MHYLTNEDPDTVISFVGVAVFSLIFLFTVTATGLSFTQVRQAFEPAESMFALVGEGMIASGEWAEEAVYATAVYTGVIPFEESSYYAVDLPFHRPSAAPMVASAMATAQGSTVVLPEPVTVVAGELPWEILYDFFKGK